MTARDVFHAHLDVCEQCRLHPMAPCDLGHRLLVAAASTNGEAPIPLNETQQRLVSEWAADDRLWTTQETVAVNLATFARAVLAALGPSEHARAVEQLRKDQP